MRYVSLVLSLLVSACSPQVIYVYADAGPMQLGDGGPLAPDSGETDAALETDAGLYPYACLTRASSGSVSQSDCARYPGRPVCDGLVYDQVQGSQPTCEALPTSWCGACGSDDQCRTGVDVHADCVFVPSALYPDQACLSPCATDSDCTFLDAVWGRVGGARCSTLPRGRYCTLTNADGPTCSDGMGGRI